MSIFTEFYAQLVGNVELKRKWWHLSQVKEGLLVWVFVISWKGLMESWQQLKKW